MKLDQKWLRLGLSVICGLLLVLLIPVLFVKNSKQDAQQYVVLDEGSSAEEKSEDATDTEFDSSFFSDETQQDNHEEAAENSPTPVEKAPPAPSPAPSLLSQDLFIEDLESSAVAKASDRSVSDMPDSARQSPTPAVRATKSNQQIKKPVTHAEKKQPLSYSAVCWRVQLGSFGKLSNAESLRSKLERKGYVVTTKKSNGGHLIRVMAGEVKTREQALQLKRELERTMGINGIVVREQLED